MNAAARGRGPQRRAPGRHRTREPPARRAQPHVTSVITVPPSLDDHSFEQVLEQLAAVPPDAKILVDARHTRWASPYGLDRAAHARADARGARRRSPCPRTRRRRRTGRARDSSSTPRSCSICTARVPKRARRRVERAARDHADREERGRPRGRGAHPAEGAADPREGAQHRREGDGRLRDDALRGVPEHRRARRARRLGGRADVHVAQATRHGASS